MRVLPAHPTSQLFILHVTNHIASNGARVEAQRELTVVRALLQQTHAVAVFVR